MKRRGSEEEKTLTALVASNLILHIISYHIMRLHTSTWSSYLNSATSSDVRINGLRTRMAKRLQHTSVVAKIALPL